MILSRRLLWAVLPVPFLFATMTYFGLLTYQGQRLRAQEAARARLMAQCLAQNCAFALESLDPTLMQVSLNGLFLQPDVLWVEAVDVQGHYMAHEDPSLVGEAALPVEKRGGCCGRFPIEVRQQIRGEVRLGLSLQRLELALERGRQKFFWLSLGSLAATALLVGWVAHRLTLPLSRLARLAADIAEGRVPIESVHERMTREGNQARRRSDGMAELRTLSRAFLEMSQQMSAGLEHERAQLLDLQSQVSSLQAFQEAIASGDAEAQVFGLTDEALVALAQGLHSMALSLQKNATSEADYRGQLEEFNRALQETRGRLEETDRYKNEFLGVVSHELRTPLTSVRAFAEILLDYPPEHQERLEFIRIIYRESDRLTNIINHLLDISRIESKRMRWKLSRVNLVHLAEQQMAALGSEADGVVLDLKVAYRPGGYLLWLDQEKVGEALESVLRNAVQLAPPGSPVTVHLGPSSRAQKGVELCVEDRGKGVPPELQELIFSKFQQVRLGDDPRGTGLSLALARAIVEAHEGTLSVESDGHLGSRFIFWFPESPEVAGS